MQWACYRAWRTQFLGIYNQFMGMKQLIGSLFRDISRAYLSTSANENFVGRIVGQCLQIIEQMNEVKWIIQS